MSIHFIIGINTIFSSNKWNGDFSQMCCSSEDCCSNGFYCKTITFVEPCQVREIKDSTFENCEALNITSLPRSITKIGSKAFYNCISLEEFTIHNVVTELGSYAFALKIAVPMDSTASEIVNSLKPSALQFSNA